MPSKRSAHADAKNEVPFVDLQSQHFSIRAELEGAMRRVFESSWFILGAEVQAFETEFADYCGVKHCVAVGSGTDALYLALSACGVGPGDEVITVSHTFVATAFAITWTGATPVFVDIDSNSYTIDPIEVERAITPKTKAIVPVHLYGQCADMKPILALAKERGLQVVEDAAQAHGATYHGRKAGGLGDLGCFSFYPSKNLGAFGDGGAIVTSNSELAERLRLLRNYGQTKKYRHESMGYNSRLDELQAAILRAKLRHLDEWNSMRRRAASRYFSDLQDRYAKPRALPGRGHVYHLFVIRSGDRGGLKARLEQSHIRTQIHYPLPVHLQPAYDHLPNRRRNLTVTERVAKEVLSLPMYPTISSEQVSRVAEVVNSHGN